MKKLVLILSLLLMFVMPYEGLSKSIKTIDKSKIIWDDGTVSSLPTLEQVKINPDFYNLSNKNKLYILNKVSSEFRDLSDNQKDIFIEKIIKEDILRFLCEPTTKQIKNDPDFYILPVTEQRKVLNRVDSYFKLLPFKEKDKVISKINTEWLSKLTPKQKEIHIHNKSLNGSVTANAFLARKSDEIIQKSNSIKRTRLTILIMGITIIFFITIYLRVKKERQKKTKLSLTILSVLFATTYIIGAMICMIIIFSGYMQGTPSSYTLWLLHISNLIFGTIIVYFVPQLWYKLTRRSVGSKRLRIVLSITTVIVWCLLMCIVIVDEGCKSEHFFILTIGVVIAFIPYSICEAVHWISEGFKE